MVQDESARTFRRLTGDFILTLFLCLFLFCTPWFHGLTGLRSQLTAEIVIFLIFLMTLPFLDFRRKLVLKPVSIEGWVSVTVGLAFFYVIFSAIPYQSLLAFFRLLSLGLFYVLVRFAVNDEKRMTVFLSTFLAAGFFYSVYGLCQYYGFLPKTFWYQPDSLASRYVNGGHFAGLLLFPLFTAAALFLKSRRRFAQGMLAVSVTGMAWAFLLTQARTEWMAFAAGMIVFACVIVRCGILKARSFFAVFVILSAGLIFFAYQGAFDILFERFRVLWNAGYFNFYSLLYRLKLWEACLLAIKDRPLGWGIGVFGLIFPQYRLNSDRFETHYAHNEFLQVGVDLGIPGILFMAAFIIFYFLKSFHFLNSSWASFSAKCAAAGFVSLFTGLLLASQADFPLRIYATDFYFVAFLALSAFLFDSIAKKDGNSSPAEEKAGPFRRNAVFKGLIFLMVSLAGFLTARQLMAQVHFEKGRDFESRFLWTRAIAHYEKAVQYAPFYAPYSESMGSAYHKKAIVASKPEKKKQMAEQGIASFKRAIQYQPYSASSYFYLAHLYEITGQTDIADGHFEKAVSLEPRNEFYLSEYGSFALRHAMAEKAVSIFERFNQMHSYLEGIELTPCAILRRCYTVTKDYELLKRVVPGNWQGHQCFGQLLAEDRRWDLAKKEFNQALEAGRTALTIVDYEAAVRQPIANIYLSHERLDEALEIYQKAAAFNSQDHEAQKKMLEISAKIAAVPAAGMSS